MLSLSAYYAGQSYLSFLVYPITTHFSYRLFLSYSWYSAANLSHCWTHSKNNWSMISNSYHLSSINGVYHVTLNSCSRGPCIQLHASYGSIPTWLGMRQHLHFFPITLSTSNSMTPQRATNGYIQIKQIIFLKCCCSSV